MRTILLKITFIAVIALGVSGLAFAQDALPLPGDLVVGDLNAPRGLAFDADGNLLVVVAGSGGDIELQIPTFEDPSVMTIVRVGMTGVVLSVAPDGTVTPLIQAIPSYATDAETTGIYRAIPNGDSLWLVYTATGAGAYWGNSVVELDAATLMPRHVINLFNFEAVNNPDGNEIDSNVADIAWGADGTLYIVDAGANTLYSWTEADGLAVVNAWSENSVPDSIETAENGDIYIGFLGAGLAPGAAKIERWSNGELAETFGGLNAVTDILLDGDTLYAVELVIFGEEGPGPGRVIRVDASGATPIAEGLLAPFGIAKGPDGALYVSFGTIAFAPGMTGGVVRLSQ